jgi:hypothetical protein
MTDWMLFKTLLEPKTQILGNGLLAKRMLFVTIVASQL